MNASNVHLTVATVVPRGDQFLMVRELDKGKEVFNQPAGHWERGETLLQAACRETLEETGWHVELEAFIGLFMSTSPSGDTYSRIAFSARALEFDAQRALDPEIIAAEWHSAAELQALRGKMRSTLVLQTLDAYLSGQRFDLSAVSTPPLMYKEP